MRKLKQIIIPLERVMEIDKIEDFNTRIHMAARLYSELGIRIVPLRPGTKILPAKQTGVNYFSGSSKLTVIEKWFGPGGRYWGWNIGAVCGEHLFIIDLDMHGSINGIEAWDKFKGPNEILCPIAMTPTGGRHLFLKWAKNLTSSTAKLAPGIDTRGGDGSPRSHAVLWPSKTPDGTYSWIQGGELPDTPTWVVDKMGVPWSSNQSEGRGNEEVGLEHEEYRYDIGRIAIMLEHVDPNVLSYEEWVFVGQAINSQHSGSDGLKLWDTWSAVGKRHVPGECERRWTGFDPAGNIRMGSLIYLAKKGGYDASNDPVGEA